MCVLVLNSETARMQCHFLLLACACASTLGICNGDRGWEESNSNFKSQLDKLVRKNSLGFMDTCDFTAELKRQEHLKQLSQFFLVTDTGGAEKEMNRILKSMADIPGSFCNRYANLQCDANDTCSCAQESFIFKLNFVREGDSCMVDEGSICDPLEVDNSPQQNTKMRNTLTRKLKCANQRNCVLKSNFQACTQLSLQDEFEFHFEAGRRRNGTENYTVTDGQMIVTLMRMCVCDGDSTVASSVLVLISLILFALRFFI